MKGFFNFNTKVASIFTKKTRKGGVPGGYEVICDEGKEPFVPPMRECHSIPLRYSDIVVDIGAYCGTYALRAAKFPVKKVVAFEPTESTFQILKRNAGVLPNLTVKKAAVVGDDRKEVKLFISSGIGVTNSLIAKKKSLYERVPAEKYEKVVADASIVKIDVEGAEYDYNIIQPGIRALIIDFHPVININWIKKANQIIESILAAGFTPVINPNFQNGWTRAGSWIREIKTKGFHKEMMAGDICCSCGIKIESIGGKSLCKKCYELWTKKERASFLKAVS